jgi:vancomycin resistance protein VanJ
MAFARRALHLIFLCLCATAMIGLTGGIFQMADVVNNFMPLILAAIVTGMLVIIASNWRNWRAVRTTIMIGIAAIAAGTVPIAIEYHRDIPAASAAPNAQFTVLTANVWYKNRDWQSTIRSIATSGADVVLLQETNGPFRAALDRLKTVYPYRSRCKVGVCQLTILSKTPLIQDKYRFRDAANRPYGPKLFWARLTAPDGLPVTVVTMHYPWPVPVGGQAKLRAEIARLFAGLDTSNFVFAGDMNLTPWTFAMRSQDAQFAPLIRHTRALATWPARIGNFSAPAMLPIDHVYAGSQWQQVSVTKLPQTGSDHHAVKIILSRARPLNRPRKM